MGDLSLDGIEGVTLNLVSEENPKQPGFLLLGTVESQSQRGGEFLTKSLETNQGIGNNYSGGKPFSF